ncbi:MAG: hypothetical protein JWR23_2680 [Mucilaginibacter sp.]|jgi:hypothetical protein|nr:hypothetical protein [Mucilaginibacter sp.]
MLIFLVFSFTFLYFFFTFVFMRKKLFDDLPKSLKLNSGTWLHIFPDSGEGYRLYDPLEGKEMGRILFDETGNWIYDGDSLGVEEQEEAAGAISGYQKEMDELFNSLKR